MGQIPQVRKATAPSLDNNCCDCRRHSVRTSASDLHLVTKRRFRFDALIGKLSCVRKQSEPHAAIAI
jgi:hypothetical protein